MVRLLGCCRTIASPSSTSLFGSLTVKDAVLGVRAAVFTAHGLSASGTLTYIQGQPPWGEGLAGIIIRAASCREPQD